ncbi:MULTISPECIES: hypothetical protein [Streptomyces]|uniref:hypothetical protein n=1 Tax=Streptomyces TaxID=1883 RepID=UPI000ABB4D2E|nr:hypothetical protein [Streptomyces sp. SID7805]MYU54233.1 hypothetical protein [Streptomyces sp. SID7805]
MPAHTDGTDECYAPPAPTGHPTDSAPAAGPPFADCVLCGAPTEYGVAQPGAVLCPVCEWQEAQRGACSG